MKQTSRQLKIGITIGCCVLLIFYIIQVFTFNVPRNSSLFLNCILDMFASIFAIMLIGSSVSDDCRSFFWFAVIQYASIWTEEICYTMFGYPEYKTIILIVFTISYILIIFAVTYFWYVLKELNLFYFSRKRTRVIPIIAFILVFIMVIINLFTGINFVINQEGFLEYNENDIVSSIIMGILGLYYGICISLEKIDRKTKFSLLSVVFLPLFALIMNVVMTFTNTNVEIYDFVGLMHLASSYIVFLNVYNRNREEYIKKDAELTNARVNILISQIQPHFISNTLGMIRSMYRTDAKAAEGAMNTFISYLQKNFSYLTSVVPVPIEREIEHTQEFVGLELNRWPDMSVEYDIKTKNFVLPAMTLQPIVENAIDHGLMPLKSGGKILISTDENETDYILTVEDNGVGFDVSKASEKPHDREHIGISNVQERVMRMCGGSMHIESRKNEGTKVTIRIPKGEKE